MREAAFLHHHAGEESAQSEAHVEDGARTIGNDNCRTEDGEREELARSRARHFPEHQRQKLSSHHHHKGDEARRPGIGKDAVDAPGIAGMFRRPGKGLHDVEKDAEKRYRLVAVNGCRKGRQADEKDHGNEVLHHQPAERCLPVHFIRELAKLQGLRDHHGRGAGNGEAEEHGRAEIPVPEPHSDARCQGRRNHHLRRSARYRHALHAHQIVHGEVKPDAEHEEHDADFGELLDHLGIDRRQSRKNACRKAGENVADKRRCAEKLFRNVAERKRQPEAGDQACNQGIIVHFAAFPKDPAFLGWRKFTALPDRVRQGIPYLVYMLFMRAA